MFLPLFALAMNSLPPFIVIKVEAAPRFELGNGAFAELCLTTWLCRLSH